MRVVLSVYRTHPAPVLQALPTGDAAARRSVLYKRLFDAFARLDGGARGGTPRVGDTGFAWAQSPEKTKLTFTWDSCSRRSLYKAACIWMRASGNSRSVPSRYVEADAHQEAQKHLAHILR